jgi:uncharacterized protein YqgC (DUF456 family)
MNALGFLATLLMLLALFVIPLGWPGLWIMVAIVGVGGLLGEVGSGVIVAAIALAATAELLEFVIVKRLSARYGGSTGAFWGAVFGGTAGVIIGMPVPVLGPVLAGIVGSFLGAGAVAYWESRDLTAAGRVGWGVVLARMLAAVAKVAAAIVILVVGGTAWIVG